jgi:ribonuclease HI/ADP-ribose pyrophosphatase YjhB (NUDIX family)
MKQRISVRAIVRDGGKILLLRRGDGQPEVVGKYELPGGSLDEAEQPEDAVSRHIQQATGLTVQVVQLLDVRSYSDYDSAVQHICIMYNVSIRKTKTKLSLSQKYDYFHWEKMQNIQQQDLTDVTRQLLNLVQQVAMSPSSAQLTLHDEEKVTDGSRVIIYSDGGSRGNPGPSASGFVVMSEDEQVIHEGGVYLGITTNNQAEYHGVQLGLEKALELGAKRVDFRIDSMLVVNQMNGIYSIKNRELWPINERIRELVSRFDKVTFTHVKREYNRLADGMVNKILNAHAQK